jgi:hypothetical protein
MDPKFYGINWDADDDNPDKQVVKRERAKPNCQFKGCSMSVSTTYGRPKPFCKNHVLESPYVQDMLRRMEDIDPVEDRKQAKAAFEAAKKQQELDDAISDSQGDSP